MESRGREKGLERSRAKMRSLGETENRQRSELQSEKSVQSVAYSRGESKVSFNLILTVVSAKQRQLNV